MSFANLFLPKECLVEHPWEMEPVNRDVWVNCQASKARINSYITAIIILIILIIAVIFLIKADKKWWALGVGMFGAFILVSTLFIGPWWSSKKAGMDFDQFKMKWDALLSDNKGDVPATRKTFGQENLQERKIQAQEHIAEATASSRSSTPSAGSTAFGALLGYEASQMMK